MARRDPEHGADRCSAGAYFINTDSIDTIWPMFGIANQMLAVIALAVVSAFLVDTGKAKYLWVTVLPMLFVFTTTTTGAVEQFMTHLTTIRTQLAIPTGRNWTTLINSSVTASLIVLMELCTVVIILAAVRKVWQSTSDAAPQVQPMISVR